MAKEIVMPKLGNTVESVVIVEWKKEIGDTVAVGEPLCEVETDKATVDVEAEIAGTLLARLYEAEDDVDVLVPFAIIGDAGEDISGMTPAAAPAAAGGTDAAEGDSGAAASAPAEAAPAAATPAAAPAAALSGAPAAGISPRARNLAASSGLAGYPASGSGPGGRIIERDVKAALEGRAPLTPAAKAAGGPAPAAGSGIGGRVTAVDVAGYDGAGAGGAPVAAGTPVEFPGPVDSVPVKGVRQLIAQRMHASLAETAQLTLNGSAEAASLLRWRESFKSAPEESGLNGISINDLLMYNVARLLPAYPEMNATFTDGTVNRYRHVHLGFAVDTPRGLMVPVIRFADMLTLRQISAEARRLAAACRDGKASPDELQGGTFTITNLGAFGVEHFTPVLNAPEVGILGVGGIVNRPVETAGGIGIEKRMGLSLTIDHQVVDGAPGARFLQELGTRLARPELAMA